MAKFTTVFGLLLVASIVTGQDVDITPREAVRRIGDELTVLCRVPYPIDSCRMKVGGISYRLKPSNQDGDVLYTGQGLNFGECGAQIKHIKEEWNGNISCELPPQTGNIEIVGVMRLLVARAPGEPQLITPAKQVFNEGDVIVAQCIVPSGRPAARITWFLGDEQLLTGTHQPIIIDEPGSDLKTISQNVSRTLRADDAGKHLVCKAEHEALDQPKIARRQLAVYYPPKRLESGIITIFGLKLGEEGRLNVTVRANPPPRVEWTVAETRLVPPQTSDDATLTTLEPLPMGNGFYNITLVLNKIVKEDVDRTYYLRVQNDLGHEELAVRISTMDEPAGVELGAGAIVAIIIGVLVLLIAISLVVFAKATDRWCFAGDRRNRDHTKNSGESSDTESAVGGTARSRLAGLSARVLAALPRSKDKVQATETHNVESEQKALADDKKGIVYAELALGEQTSADKPPPPATEYAEIVYTDKTQPDAKD